MKLTVSIFPTLCLAMLLAVSLNSCETDAYEKGTGQYSLMTTDMADVAVNSSKMATEMLTDDDSRMAFCRPYYSSWITTADTIYRSVVYYNKVSEGTAEAISITPVPTLSIRHHSLFQRFPQDPVDVESMWLSGNRKYLNAALMFKTAQADNSSAVHQLAVVQDTLLTADGKHTAVCRLIHDQGGIPQYFTARQFVSIVLPTDADSLSISVETFKGTVVRKFAL